MAIPIDKLSQTTEKVEIRSSSLIHGRGLFSTDNIKKGDVILVEQALMKQQSLGNKQIVPICGNCFCLIGTAKIHALTSVKKLSRAELVDLDWGKWNEDDRTEHFTHTLVSCSYGCGEVYCSTNCRDQHISISGHDLLCVGPIPQEQALEHPLVLFRVHAAQTNEIFLLVADVIAKIIRTTQNNGGNLEAALQPFKPFVQNIWWEISLPKHSQYESENQSENLMSILQHLVHESRTFLEQSIPTTPECHQALLANDEFFARVVGMFEQNNVAIRVESPLKKLVNQILEGKLDSSLEGLMDILLSQNQMDSCNNDEKDVNDEEDNEEDGNDAEEGSCHSGQDHNHHHHSHAENDESEEDEKEDDDDDNNEAPEEENDEENNLNQTDILTFNQEDMFSFPPLDGTALYTHICAMNHSCDPNAIVLYNDAIGEPLFAVVVALKDIKKGDELLQSYIDQTMPVEDRQEALRDYGFICSCRKCISLV